MITFPLRERDPEPSSLSRLAALLGLPAPEREVEVRGVAPLGTAGPDQLGLLTDRRYLGGVAGSRAGALLVSRELSTLLPEGTPPSLVVEDAHFALITILEAFFPALPADPEIHPTAVLGRRARLGARVRIGPYAVIEDGAVVSDDTCIGSHVVVGAGAAIGASTILHPHVVVYPGAVLGERVIVHSGARIGVDGFGYAADGGRPRKVPQVGRCVIEDDVEIGANATIDRGSIGETRVRTGAKLDNLVHLAHNVSVGPGALLAALVGVAGSTTLGAGVQAGGQSGVGGHLTVGPGARIAAQAGVVRDVPPGETVMGFPARPRGEFLRTAAGQRRVRDLAKRLRAIEKRVGEEGA